MGMASVAKSVYDWYKEVDGMRICSLYSDMKWNCNIIVGAINSSQAYRLAKIMKCAPIRKLGQCAAKTCDSLLLDRMAFCDLLRDFVIKSLLIPLGFDPEGIRVFWNLSHALTEEEVYRESRMQPIITREDAELLGFKLTKTSEDGTKVFSMRGLRVLNALLRRAIATKSIRAIIQVDLSKWSSFSDRYWAIVYEEIYDPDKESHTPIVVYPDDPRYEKVREIMGGGEA
jgi:hypothetical protein